MIRIILILLLATAWSVAAPPRPLPDHPGNVFVEGEEVVLPPTDGPTRIFDYDGKEAKLGKLPVGYYEVRQGDTPVSTLGVIAPLQAPTPATSPIGLDVAMAWFYMTESQQRAAANLCAIAGVNWVRDRLNWGVMEPERGKFAERNIYDDTARIQTEAGLRVLQVNHISPPWANPDPKRFPTDLRDVHGFYREMAKRWKGQVLAFEPWNEADIANFGGHTGSEMASLQKAAYLGLKAGNPNVIASQNVFAIARQQTLDDFAANEVWPYFDTYNLHHYVGLEKYPAHYAAHRAVSGGRPMWVSECNVPVQWSGDPKQKEPNDKDLAAQSRRVAKIFAASLHEGSVNTFYFMLPHYVEGQTQFGILHEDLTPRPAYVALAAVGRLLADAKPIGQWRTDEPDARGFCFLAKPDGQEKAVLVAWRNDKHGEVKLNAPVERVFDHLGREGKGSWVGQLHLTNAPVFAIMTPAIGKTLRLDPPPELPEVKDGSPAKIVLQAIVPAERVELKQSAYRARPGETLAVKLVAYNFSEVPAEGKVSGDGYEQFVRLDPNTRVELPAMAVEAKEGTRTIRLKGDFGRAGQAVLSMRIVAAEAAR